LPGKTVSQVGQGDPNGDADDEGSDSDDDEIPNPRTTKCSRSGNGCGPFGLAGTDLSVCCDNSSSTMSCDGGGVSLISNLCPVGYHCVQYGMGMGSKKRYGTGVFAQCEMKEP
jgi:hypothetical protein